VVVRGEISSQLLPLGGSKVPKYVLQLLLEITKLLKTKNKQNLNSIKILTKFKSNQIVLNKISHISTDNQEPHY
jgi:hypothetical protein